MASHGHSHGGFFGFGGHSHADDSSQQYQRLPESEDGQAPIADRVATEQASRDTHHYPQHEQHVPEVDIVSAVQRGLLVRVQHLVEAEGADVRKPDHEDVTLLHWAAINNRIPVVQYLLEKGAEVDALGGHLQSTALHWAIRQGHLDTAVLLMRHGADPAKTDKQGFNALHLAAQFGHTVICAYLLAKGMDVDALDADGRTALMWAAYRVFTPDTVRLLISMRADLNMQDTTRNTALHWAVFNGNRVAMKELVLANARTDIRNDEDKTPADIARDKGNKYCQDFLQQATGADYSPWLRRYASNKDFKKKVLWAAPMLFLVVSGYMLHRFTVGYALAGVACAWFLCAFLCRTFWLSHGQNPFTLAVFVDSLVLVGLVDLFVITPVSIERLWLTLFAWAAFTACAYNFYVAWRADPGFLKPPVADQKRTVTELAEKGELDLSRFCTTCLIRKPLRSKHCGICGSCVARFDHHCPFVGNCIGVNNHKAFNYYLFYLVVGGVAIFQHYMYYLRTKCSVHLGWFEQTYAYFHEETMVAWLLLYAMLQVTWVVFLFASQSYQVAVNLTTNERILWRRMDYLKDEEDRYYNPFDKGVIANTLDFYDGFGLCGRKGGKYDWSNIYDAQPSATDEMQMV